MHGSGTNSEHATELQNELCHLRAQVSDLLERRHRDEAHRQQLVAIVEASRDAIWSWTPDCIITSWNAEAERLFQYRADEIIGKSLLTLVPPEGVVRAQLALDRLLNGGWYDQYETVRLRKDGVHVPVELTVSPIRDAEGAVTGIATVCRDITMRRRFEEALQESEERFAKVFRLAPIAMSISTLDEGRYLDVNDSLVEITGYSRDEIVGRTASDLKVFADPDGGARIRELLAGGQPVRGLELRLRGRNGDIRTCLLAADVIELKDTRCLLTASVDITERKESEATLQFLDALGKETAKIANADAILVITTRMLGEHLGVAVCAYADMDADEDGFTIRGNWSAPGSMSIVGHYSLAAFGKLAVTNLRAGFPLILNENRAQLPPEEAATFLSIGLVVSSAGGSDNSRDWLGKEAIIRVCICFGRKLEQRFRPSPAGESFDSGRWRVFSLQDQRSLGVLERYALVLFGHWSNSGRCACCYALTSSTPCIALSERACSSPS